MHLTDWHRKTAAQIAAAFPLVDGRPARAKGNHLVAQNDEPEPEDRFSGLNAALDEIRAKADTGAFTAPKLALQPPKPWAILAKENARAALAKLRVMRTQPGYAWVQTLEQQRAYADSWVKEALRAHLFAKGLTPSQTFGSALKVLA